MKPQLINHCFKSLTPMKILSIAPIILVLFFSLSFTSCKKRDKQIEMNTIIENKNISDEEALYGISKVLFLDLLKSFKSEVNQAGKQDVVIEYGGNRANTFHSQENYSEKIQFDVVRYILLYFQSGSKRNLDNLRISLVKPYYVKEPDVKKEIMEEFEVFRVSISLNDLNTIQDWENPKLLSDNKNANNAKVIELFNQVRLKWKIELNELRRIELK